MKQQQLFVFGFVLYFIAGQRRLESRGLTFKGPLRSHSQEVHSTLKVLSVLCKSPSAKKPEDHPISSGSCEGPPLSDMSPVGLIAATLCKVTLGSFSRSHQGHFWSINLHRGILIKHNTPQMKLKWLPAIFKVVSFIKVTITTWWLKGKTLGTK